jgi:carbonic anhydrase
MRNHVTKSAHLAKSIALASRGIKAAEQHHVIVCGSKHCGALRKY